MKGADGMEGVLVKKTDSLNHLLLTMKPEKSRKYLIIKIAGNNCQEAVGKIDVNDHNSVQRTILQWNCQGIRNKKDEIIHLIKLFKFKILVFHETKLWNNSFKIPLYVEYYRDGHFNRTPHGGVGFLVHQDIPHSRVNISSTIQAVAVSMEQRITICSVYSSGRHALTTQSLKLLFE